MPSIGDRVEIAGTGTFWDGKRGKVGEEHPDGTYSVAVEFGDGNETLQDFDGGYLEPVGSDEGDEGTTASEAEGKDKRSESMDEDIKWEEAPEKDEAGDDARRKALADYLGIDVEDVGVAGGHEFDTPEGDYLVLTEDEAYDRALEDIQGTIDEMGLDAFTENFRDYILNNLLDDYHIKEEAIVEYYVDYAEDIEHEPSDEFGNRLIEELYEHEILTDDDFEDGEDGKKDHYALKPSVDLEAKEYEYAQMLSEDVIVSDWLYDTFGDDVEKMSEWLSSNGYIDWDEVKRQCIRDDGVAHFIAGYDGEEIELEGDLYAYRIN